MISLESFGECRGFLQARGDRTELHDGSLASYIRGKYGVTVNASMPALSAPVRSTPVPPVRTDSVSHAVYREDAPAPVPPVPTTPRFRDKRADAYNVAHGIQPLTHDTEPAAVPTPRFRDRRADAWAASHGLPLAPNGAAPENRGS